MEVRRFEEILLCKFLSRQAVQKLTDVERALITTEKQNERTCEERDAAKSIFLALDEKFVTLQTKHDEQAMELAVSGLREELNCAAW